MVKSQNMDFNFGKLKDARISKLLPKFTLQINFYTHKKKV